MKGEFKIPNSKRKIFFRNLKLKSQNLAIFSLLAAVLSIYSCASLGIVPDGKIIRNNFSRTYNVDFAYFHPRLNLALQDYAQRYKGNSFQVVRLGSDAVIIRGLYQGDQDRGRFPTFITIKPMSPQKTWMEIKISSSNPEASAEYLERAAKELFQIVEKGTGFRPQE
jgi:hypothetical protein